MHCTTEDWNLLYLFSASSWDRLYAMLYVTHRESLPQAAVLIALQFMNNIGKYVAHPGTPPGCVQDLSGNEDLYRHM